MRAGRRRGTAGELGTGGSPRGGRASPTPGSGAASLRAHDGFGARALAGRRSAAQLATSSWDGDPASYRPVLSTFALPQADLVE